MAQVGVGKSVVGGDQNVPEELKPLSIPVVQQSLQRTQREDLYYSQQQQNGRGVSMTSPANSLGTESLVTPNTTPEPSGSPRTLDQEASVLPPPTISTTYDRYMQSPPMNVPPYVAYPYYSQPTVYLVHPPMSYMPHGMEPVHMSYDMSVPPPNLGYMPVAPHMFSHSMYKMSPQDRFVPYDQTNSPMAASPLGSGAVAPQVPQSNEVIMAAQRPETPIPEYAADHHLSQPDVCHLEDLHLQTAYEPSDGGVVEITELIEEVQIIDPKTSTTPVPPVETASDAVLWYESANEEHLPQPPTDQIPAPDAFDLVASPADGIQDPNLDNRSVQNQAQEINNTDNNNSNNNNIRSPNQRDGRNRDHYQHRDNQRHPSNNRRDRNFRESSNGRYDHDRRSETPDKRYRGGNPNYRGPPRDDRRYSNPEHSGSNQYRPKRSQRDFRGGDYENQGPSRENSAVRRGDNRQRFFNSPRRDEEHNRYDGQVRRSGSYRNQWRDDFNGNRNDEQPKPVPRGRPERDRTDSAQRNNNRRPPVASRQQDGQRGGRKEVRSHGSDEDSLEFLLPSAVGVNEKLDVKSMISEDAVSMKCVASQKPPRHVHHPQDQIPGPAVGKKANRRPE